MPGDGFSSSRAIRHGAASATVPVSVGASGVLTSMRSPTVGVPGMHSASRTRDRGRPARGCASGQRSHLVRGHPAGQRTDALAHLADVPRPAVEALVESLHHDMAAGDVDFQDMLLPRDTGSSDWTRPSAAHSLRPRRGPRTLTRWGPCRRTRSGPVAVTTGPQWPRWSTQSRTSCWAGHHESLSISAAARTPYAAVRVSMSAMRWKIYPCMQPSWIRTSRPNCARLT